ncbi:MAG: HAD-IIB family hydrolase [Oscillospiraceae bacterium]|nr:HAD-IIB family hydrolase [Oscillospiraceae bacterium]
MGKFDGILFLSDFDNTILYTAAALKNGGAVPEMSPRNIEALNFFMAEGGLFGVATGRATAAYAPYDHLVPTNVPAVVYNGAGIYDYEKQEYVETRFLGESSRAHIQEIVNANPAVSLEMFHAGTLLQVYRESKWNKKHTELTGMGYEVVSDLSAQSVEMPLSKALFLGETEDLLKAAAFIDAQSWRGEYELVLSSDYLLELTAKGATKGDMAKSMKERLGCKMLVCAGDHMNDLSMLRAADRAFCPSNAVEGVRAEAHTVGHCQDGAIADMIEVLEKELS